jgi:hypothetical protein
MTQEAIKTRKQAKQTAMIVSRVASESIRNMNETKDSKKKQKQKICKIIKQQPNMLDMMKINRNKQKQQKASEFQKLTQQRLIYDELSRNLEPKVNDVQLS